MDMPYCAPPLFGNLDTTNADQLETGFAFTAYPKEFWEVERLSQFRETLHQRERFPRPYNAQNSLEEEEEGWQWVGQEALKVALRLGFRRAEPGQPQLCEVMCLERWWRSRKDSLHMGHLSFSSRRLLTSGSSAYSFLWWERMW